MDNKKSYNLNLTLVIFSVIFFGWGLLTSLNGALIDQLKVIFNLDEFRSNLINFTFFATYFFVALIFFLISQKRDILNTVGYKYLTVAGLSIAAIGAYLFYPASALLSYPLFMGALVVLASGITILQLAANTYIISLSADGLGASRLNLVQAINSLGATLGPTIGGVLIVNVLEVPTSDFVLLSPAELLSFKTIQSVSMQLPYWVIATSLFVLAALVFFLPMPDLLRNSYSDSDQLESKLNTNIWLATIGIFVYVGAEVTIGANLGNIIDKHYPSLAADKSFLTSSYWALAMIGRFFGGFILRFVQSGILLAVFALCATGLVIIGGIGSGDWTIYLLVFVGFFNSIMFPGIYASGLYQLKGYTGKGASMLIMAIAGGAVIPVLYTVLAPAIGDQVTLLIAAICYLYIAYYGKSHYKLSEK